MRKLIALSIVTSVGIFLTNCRSPQSNGDNANLTKKQIIDTSFLADKNFVYKNLTNTFNFDKHFKFDDKNNLYTDSMLKVALVALTPRQRVQLIAPFIKQVIGVSEAYPRDEMEAYFVSKQNKIGIYQPIIIEINGDDYQSLTMIILDKNKKPVSGFNLNGGMDGGQPDINDSLISYTNRYSKLNGVEIATYNITETNHLDTTIKKTIVDSIVFKSIIGRTGKILTRQVFKIDYVK